MVTDRHVKWATYASRVAGTAFVACAVGYAATQWTTGHWVIASLWSTMALTGTWTEWKGWRWEQWPRGTGDVLRQQREIIRMQQETAALYLAAGNITRHVRSQGDRPS